MKLNLDANEGGLNIFTDIIQNHLRDRIQKAFNQFSHSIKDKIASIPKFELAREMEQTTGTKSKSAIAEIQDEQMQSNSEQPSCSKR